MLILSESLSSDRQDFQEQSNYEILLLAEAVLLLPAAA